jgi:hypothetical protein
MAFFAQIILLFLWKRLEEQQKDIFCGTARCNNSAHWQDDAAREAEILGFASRATSRRAK